MAITAKVSLGMRMEQTDGTVGLHFYPNYTDPANKAWSVATPSLYYQMIVKPEVAELFKHGCTYTVTFEEDVTNT